MQKKDAIQDTAVEVLRASVDMVNGLAANPTLHVRADALGLFSLEKLCVHPSRHGLHRGQPFWRPS